jgi:prevent-host-death family protein
VRLAADASPYRGFDQRSGQPYASEVVSFNIYEAKTQLSKLLRRVRAGQEVIIADAGTPIAKLVPIEQPKVARVLGTDRGKIWVAPDAFDPLTGEDLAVWSGALFPEPPKRQPRAPTQRRRRRARRSAGR